MKGRVKRQARAITLLIGSEEETPEPGPEDQRWGGWKWEEEGLYKLGSRSEGSADYSLRGSTVEFIFIYFFFMASWAI